MIFAKLIFENKPINIYNYGNMERDFTYIDDVVESIYKCCFKPAIPDLNFEKSNPNPATSFAPYRILNIGNKNPVNLIKFINILESNIGKKAIKKFYANSTWRC